MSTFCVYVCCGYVSGGTKRWCHCPPVTHLHNSFGVPPLGGAWREWVRVRRYALYSNNEPLARLLISRGASVNVCTAKNESMLHAAAVGGNVDLMELVLA